MAMALLEKESPQRFHLNLCGSFVGAKTETVVEVYDEVTLHAYIKENGLEECVTYHGQVIGKQKEKQFTQANIFLLPTSYPWEGQPLSIIEALAFSIPVISCNHKGIPEMVECGRTGLFVKPKAPRSIASAIIDITEDSGRYSNMSLSAREHYEGNFKREVHLNKLIQVIYG
jgi:glycosyltransferase involved in cell wall biosynthesis